MWCVQSATNSATTIANSTATSQLLSRLPRTGRDGSTIDSPFGKAPHFNATSGHMFLVLPAKLVLHSHGSRSSPCPPSSSNSCFAWSTYGLRSEEHTSELQLL